MPMSCSGSFCELTDCWDVLSGLFRDCKRIVCRHSHWTGECHSLRTSRFKNGSRCPMAASGIRCPKSFSHRVPAIGIGHREPFLNRLVLSE